MPRHTIIRVPYLNNISNITTMCVIKIIKMFVFIHFWYEGFNGVICLYLAPMLVHQFLCCQCWSVCFLDFHESNSYSIFFVPTWVILKLWKGVFSYNFGMDNLMVKCVLNEHQYIFINSHLFSIDQSVSLILQKSYSYLWFFVPAWATLNLSKGVFSYHFGMENLMMQSVFNVHQCMFINFHLVRVDQCVSLLIFNESYSYLMVFLYQHAWY